MLQIRVKLAIVLLPALPLAWRQTKGQTSTSPTIFVIDDNRPYVYLTFDRMGKGVRFSDDEPPQRVWLHFVNDCRVGIVLRTFGVPEGSPKDEVGVMHDVAKDRKSKYKLTLKTKSSEPRHQAKMPMDTTPTRPLIKNATLSTLLGSWSPPSGRHPAAHHGASTPSSIGLPRPASCDMTGVGG
jgi:hypothetical protein